MAEEDRLEPAYWAVIPSPVRYDPKLRANAKLLYCELSSLATKKGYCWATNQYFADLYGLSVKTVNDLIQSLNRRGYIRIEMGKNHKGTVRRIYVGVLPEISEPSEGYTQKGEDPPGGYTQKSEEGSSPFCASHKDNNLKSLINTPLPPTAKDEKYLPAKLMARVLEYAGTDGELLEALLAFAENRAEAAKTPIKTDRALTLLLNKLDRLSGGDRALKVALLDKAIEHNWQSVYELRDDELPNARAAPAPTQARVLERTGVREL